MYTLFSYLCLSKHPIVPTSTAVCVCKQHAMELCVEKLLAGKIRMDDSVDMHLKANMFYLARRQLFREASVNVWGRGGSIEVRV